MAAPRRRVAWLKRSLRTKDTRQANILAKPVLIEFDRILEQATKRLETRPKRTELSDQEISRLSSYHYASLLEENGGPRLDDLGDEEQFRQIGRQLVEEGVPAVPSFPRSEKPAFGLSERQLSKKYESVASVLPAARQALSKSDVSFVQEELDDLLDSFDIQLQRENAEGKPVRLLRQVSGG